MRAISVLSLALLRPCTPLEFKVEDRKPLQVVSMITSVPEDFDWRAMVRMTLPELTGGVTALGRPVQVVIRFAVGRLSGNIPLANRSQMQARLNQEQEKHGDLALLDITDGSKLFHSTGQHHGKIWHLFDWALRNFPGADLVFKQDDDTIVFWREALPRMLNKAFDGRPTTLSFERLYVGRLCPWQFCGPVFKYFANESAGDQCATGILYGLSSDIIRWAVPRSKPIVANEDGVTCQWAHTYAAEVRMPLNQAGLLLQPEFDHAWMHPAKTMNFYTKCFLDRKSGCRWHDLSGWEYFKLPERKLSEQEAFWLASRKAQKHRDGHFE